MPPIHTHTHTHTQIQTQTRIQLSSRLVIILFVLFGSFRFDFVLSFIANAAAIAWLVVNTHTLTHKHTHTPYTTYHNVFVGLVLRCQCAPKFRARRISSSDYLHQLLIAV